MTIKQRWESVCADYVQRFCKRMKLDIEDSYWVADNVGDILFISDYFFSMSDIRYVVDNNVKPEMVFSWYDYVLRLGILGKTEGNPNLQSWCKGCPRLSEEEICALENLKKDVQEAELRLKKSINELN